MYTQIFFDFDSTLVNGETLDVLAEFAGVGDSVRALTDASMNGEVPFELVFKKKLDMIAPSRLLIDQMLKNGPELVMGAAEVIDQLHYLNREVFILTSNFTSIVHPYAERLGIPKERVIANRLFHDDQGAYLGFDEAHPLARPDGKRIVIEQFIRHSEEALMIGDSVTDLACQPVVGRFIGFGGVVVRETVRQRADVFVSDADARKLLPYIL